MLIAFCFNISSVDVVNHFSGGSSRMVRVELLFWWTRFQIIQPLCRNQGNVVQSMWSVSFIVIKYQNVGSIQHSIWLLVSHHHRQS